jgi:integrase
MEALNLTVKDVDLKAQVLHIRNAKFEKDRTVPFSDELTETFNRYLFSSRHTCPDDNFFTSPFGGHYNGKSVGSMFRQLLAEAQITHCGRNKGPRVHDFRHTFAVTCLKKWINAGADIQARLPILSAYLGHADLRGTQRYLRLTSQMFPRITELFEKSFGAVFTAERTNNEQTY